MGGHTSDGYRTLHKFAFAMDPEWIESKTNRGGAYLTGGDLDLDFSAAGTPA
jgi:hypothetical protein